MQRTYRVVVAKPGVDDEDRGSHVIARNLRDAGFEVIIAGSEVSLDTIVRTVVHEDADALGLAMLADSSTLTVTDILQALKDNGREDVVVLVGATSPLNDQSYEGASPVKVFDADAVRTDMSSWLESTLDERERQLS